MGMIIVAVVTSLVASVLYGELVAWAPRLARWIVRKAAARQPGELGERLAEEWLALLEDIPGALSQLVLAMNYAFASLQMSRERAGHRLGVRAVDVVVSIGMIAFIAPLYLMLSLVAKLFGGGSIFVFRTVETADGRSFRACRFRTSVEGRVTPYGMFLRRSHLNELPLLFNVVVGDMSLVDTGPSNNSVQGEPPKPITGIFLPDAEPFGVIDEKLARLCARYRTEPRVGTYLLILLLHVVRTFVRVVPPS